jgi:nitrous oxide reductase
MHVEGKLLTKNDRANSRLTEYRIKLLVFDLILDKPNIEKNQFKFENVNAQ